MSPIEYKKQTERSFFINPLVKYHAIHTKMAMVTILQLSLTTHCQSIGKDTKRKGSISRYPLKNLHTSPKGKATMIKMK